MANAQTAALTSPSALSDALATIPSRAAVEVWLKAWPSLDAEHGAGHVSKLEDALFETVSEPGKVGFRAIWVLALLAQDGVLTSKDAPVRLMALLDESEDLSCQRELIRALLHLPLSGNVLSELLEWACHVVFLEGLPPAQYHMAARVMEKAVVASEGQLPVESMREALDQLQAAPHPAHLNKKAALLMARLP